jgi:hypothetical protein
MALISGGAGGAPSWGTLGIAYGGTGGTTQGTAQAALGLAIGTNVQAWNANLDLVAAGNWTGDALINTVGTITAGTWHANPITVAYGGTGLASGNVGGILFYSAGTTLASTNALDANKLVLGGGASGPSTPVGLGTGVQVLHGNAGGAPSWGSVVAGDLDPNISISTTGTLNAGAGTFTSLNASSGGISLVGALTGVTNITMSGTLSGATSVSATTVTGTTLTDGAGATITGGNGSFVNIAGSGKLTLGTANDHCLSGASVTIDATTGVITTDDAVNGGTGLWTCTLNDNKINAGTSRIYISINSGVSVGSFVSGSATAMGAGTATITVYDSTMTQAAGLKINILVVN